MNRERTLFTVIGTTTADLFISGLERMPALEGDEFTTASLVFCDDPLSIVLGGNGGNTAYVLARLGAPAALCSGTGTDPFGDLLGGWLRDVGVNLEGLVRSPAEATSTTAIITDHARNRLAFHHHGASRTFAPSEVPGHLFERARVLLVTGYTLLPRWRPQGFAEALARARKAGALTALDLGPAIGRPATLPEVAPFLSDVNYLISNEHELAVFAGTSTLEDGLAEVLKAGARCFVLKRGPRGAVVCRPDAPVLAVPAISVAATSTVGAGDSFNAGFLYGVAEGWDLLQAVRFANTVAALVVSAQQGVLGCPDRARIASLLAKFYPDAQG